MRYARWAALSLSLAACARARPTELQTAPPTLDVIATTRILSTGGNANLEVSASVQNNTSSHFRLEVGSRCPLYVRLFPDPTGQYADSLAPSMGCISSDSIVDLAPGDTSSVLRVLPADSLANYAPGTYGVNVVVTTTAGVIGAWAGAIQLPLAVLP